MSTGGALESLRMTDREVVLRALSFMAFGHEEYRKYDDLNAFLVDSMEKLNSEYSAQALDNLAEEFKESLLKVYAIFGRYAFRKYYYAGGRRSPFNKALFEAWVCAANRYPIGILVDRKKVIQEAFIHALNNDTDFIKSVTTSTGQSNAVKTRFSTIAQLLKTATSDN